jgi:hypothetical protein
MLIFCLLVDDMRKRLTQITLQEAQCVPGVVPSTQGGTLYYVERRFSAEDVGI